MLRGRSGKVVTCSKFAASADLISHLAECMSLRAASCHLFRPSCLPVLASLWFTKHRLWVQLPRSSKVRFFTMTTASAVPETGRAQLKRVGEDVSAEDASGDPAVDRRKKARKPKSNLPTGQLRAACSVNRYQQT